MSVDPHRIWSIAAETRPRSDQSRLNWPKAGRARPKGDRTQPRPGPTPNICAACSATCVPPSLSKNCAVLFLRARAVLGVCVALDLWRSARHSQSSANARFSRLNPTCRGLIIINGPVGLLETFLESLPSGAVERILSPRDLADCIGHGLDWPVPPSAPKHPVTLTKPHPAWIAVPLKHPPRGLQEPRSAPGQRVRQPCVGLRMAEPGGVARPSTP